MSWACAVLLSGCAASGPSVKTSIPGDLRVEAIAIQPFGFRWPESASRSLLLAGRIEAQLDAAMGDKVLLFAPPDFRVYRPEADSWAGTNVVALFPEWQVRPDHALVLRGWAEKRSLSSRQEISNAQGNQVGTAAAEETTYVAHVELVAPSTQTVVVEVNGKAQVDPFAESPVDEADPTPELTTLVKSLVAEAIQAVAPSVHGPAPAHDFGLTTLWVPQAAIQYEEPGRASLEKWLATQDPLEADIQRVSVMRFANPGLPDAGATQFTRMPGGLFVTGLPPGSPLRAGDLIVQIRGEPALPQTLQRAKFAPGPVPVRVRHPDGTFAELTLR